MPVSQWIELSIAAVCIIVASFLAMAESALSSVSKGRAEQMVEAGASGAKQVLLVTEDPAPYLNASMLVRTLMQVASIVLVCQVVFSHTNALWERLLIAGGVMVLVSFIVWGVAPLTIGRQRASRMAPRAAAVVRVLEAMLGPIPALMIMLGNALTPGRGYTDGPFSSEAELRELVDRAEASEVIESDERRMIHSVFDLGDTLVKEVMVPRTDMVFVQSTKTLRQVQSLALRSGFSRIPVIGENVDDVLGVIYLKDVVRRVFDHPDAARGETVEQLMRTAEFTPDSKPVDALLREMQTKRNHMVVVVDEFGGTAGLATIEDVLEEIVGEIVDEYDAEPDHTEQVTEGVYRVSARMPIEELGEMFGREGLFDDDVETVGGLMAKQLSMVPIPGSVIEWEGIRIEAETATGRRHQIDTCLVQAAEPADDESATVPGGESDRVH